jgi:predicted RNase H-like HicB family nuclease
MKLTVNIVENNNRIIANCPELDVHCFCDDRENAIQRIMQVIKFYIDSAVDLGLNIDISDHKITINSSEYDLECNITDGTGSVN